MSHGRLVLVPCPYQGHINPMLQLATVLHSRGFSITIVHTHYNSPNPSNHPCFTFFSIPDGLSDRDISSGDYTSLVLSLNANCVVPFEEYLVQMMKQQKKPVDQEISCIVYDELMFFSDAVAKSLKLRSIIFRTNSAATFLGRSCVLLLIADGCIPSLDSVLKNDMDVPEHYPLRFKDLPTSAFGTIENFVKAVSNSRSIGTSSAIIWNTTDFLEKVPLAKLQRQCHVPIFTVAPLHKLAPSSSNSLLKEDTSCISWLDKQSHHSVVYVSVGSLASMDVNELTEMAWGLANSKQPFLWVIRPGSILGSKWIESLPEGFEAAVGERGCIVKWAPQKQVLKHEAIGGFWTHCGWNSTLESICEGVPMICRPIFGDQKVTARYVSHEWKVGLQLENYQLERWEIERAIRRLMVDKEGEELRQRAIDLQKKTEFCIKEGGSSSNSLKELVEFIMQF